MSLLPAENYLLTLLRSIQLDILAAVHPRYGMLPCHDDVRPPCHLPLLDISHAVNSFLPETLRLLVGDGSITPSKMHRPLILMVGAGRRNATAKLAPFPPFSNPLRILTYLDVMNLLILNGVIYSLFYAVTATVSILFQTTYPFLNETDTGLCFLAIGGGTVIGGLSAGNLLDRDYRKMKEQIAREASTDSERPVSAERIIKDDNFPIERARMRMVPFHLIVYTACCAGYGWCLEKKVNIAVVLVLQVICKCSSSIAGVREMLSARSCYFRGGSDEHCANALN